MTKETIRKFWKDQMVHSPVPGSLRAGIICWLVGHTMKPIEIEIRPCGAVEGFYRCDRCGRRGYSLG
jgi:hypothetical protein